MPHLHDDPAPAYQVERFLEGYGHAGCFNDDIGPHALGHVLEGLLPLLRATFSHRQHLMSAHGAG